MAIKGQLRGTGNIKVATMKVGATDVNLSTKSIQELSDVNATETDGGVLKYNAATDKWVTETNVGSMVTTIDGGTF